MAVVPTRGYQVGAPGPGGGVPANIGAAMAEAMEWARQIEGAADTIIRETEERRALREDVELAEARRNARDTLDQGIDDAMKAPNLDDAEAIYKKAEEEAAGYAPENQKLAMRFNADLQNIYADKAHLYRSAYRRRDLYELAAKDAINRQAALQSRNEIEYEKVVKEGIGRLRSETEAEYLLKNYKIDSQIEFARTQIAANPDAIIDQMNDIKTREGVTQEQLAKANQVQNIAEAERAQAQRKWREIQDTTEAEAFDKLQGGQLTVEWLAEKRANGELPEGRYQTYINALARNPEDVELNYGYWENIVARIDMVKAGVRDPEFVAAIKKDIADGYNRAFDAEDAKSLRRSLTTALDPTSPANHPAVKKYKDALRSLWHANALIDKGEGAEREKANTVAFLKKDAQLDALIAQHGDDLPTLQKHFEAMLEEEKKRWYDAWFIDWLIIDPQERQKQRERLGWIAEPLGKGLLLPMFQKESIEDRLAQREEGRPANRPYRKDLRETIKGLASE